MAVPPPGVSRTTSPSPGRDTSSAPSGVHAASRASGTAAHTDIDQPAGMSTWCGSNSPLSASGTTSVDGCSCCGAAAVADGAELLLGAVRGRGARSAGGRDTDDDHRGE